MCLPLDRSSGSLLKKYIGHQHNSYKIEADYENDHEHIVCVTEKGTLMHWNLLTAQVAATTDASSLCHRRSGSSLTYHPSEPLFITSSYDGTVKLWKSQISSRKNNKIHVGGSYEKRQHRSNFANR